MKTFKIILSVPAVLALVWFSSCGGRDPIWMESIVYPDGQIDRVLSYQSHDSTHWDGPIYFLEDPKEWRSSITIDTFYYVRKIDSLGTQTGDSVKHEVYRKTKSRRFRSAKEANQAFATTNDSLFRATSHFEKKFKWFYTHIRYADTYHVIWRLPHIPEDYLTPEDYAFIKRLPPEGNELSRGDERFLSDLEKKKEELIQRSLFEVLYEGCEQLIKEGSLEDRWKDSLKTHKEELYSSEELLATFEKGGNYKSVLALMDSLGIILPKDREYQQWGETTRKLNEALVLIMVADRTLFNHKIMFPGELISTNADSVSGGALFWHPRYNKFLFTDYTMYVESRKLNYWEIVVTVVLAGILVFLGLRKWLH
jgi:hypothetical protein